MNLQIFDDYTALSRSAAQEIIEILKANPKAHLCIAAGHTSLGIFKELKEAFDRREISFSDCRFTAMDEWLHMNDTTPGSCGDFLRKNFLSLVDFKEENIVLFDGKAQDPKAECQRVQQVLEDRGPFDYLLLGIGMNGHLALNEPGSSFEGSVHVTELDSVTQNVGQKYFDTQETTALTGGVTIGIGDMAKSKRIVLAVNGEKKRDILAKIMDAPVSEELPATVLKSWPQADIYCDKLAAGALRQ